MQSKGGKSKSKTRLLMSLNIYLSQVSMNQLKKRMEVWFRKTFHIHKKGIISVAGYYKGRHCPQKTSLQQPQSFF